MRRLAALEAEVRERAAHDRAFRAISDAIRDEADPAAIAATVAGMLARHLGIAEAMLAERGAGGAMLVLHRAGGVRPARPPRAFATMLAVLGKGGTVRHGDLARSNTAAARVLRRRGAGAVLAAPVVIDGSLCAALILSHHAPRAWSDEDVRLAENLAERAHAAMARARAAAAAAARERHHRFLIDWSDAVRGRTDPDAILDETLERLGLQLGNGVGFAEMDGAGRLARLRRRGADVPLADAALAFARAAWVGGDAAGLVVVEAEGRAAWSAAEAELVHDVAVRLSSTLTHVRAERRREESEALLAAFMERAPLGMHVKDAGGRYLRANPELAFALGHPREALIGRRPAEIMPPRVADRLEALDTEARGGATASAELADPAREDHHTLLAVAFPIEGAGEAATGGFTIDLSERAAAEAALERSRDALHQSEKLSALGGLLAGVAHELNNPLSIVTAQADLIEHLAGPGPIAERAGKLRAAADRCARIVRTFLAMARRQDPVRRPVAVGQVVEAALGLVGYGLAVDGIAVERRLAPDLPPIEADPDQLHQIVVNLLVNAQHALKETAADAGDRRVTVTTRAEDGRVVVEVADSGPGIPAEVRRRIFDPFFTTKPQGQGTGMGLAFSQGLAEAHGGTLSLVPPTAAGGEGGATFRLSLPCDPPAAAPPPTRSVGRTRAALVVDDRRDQGEALAQLLAREGYRVRVVENGSAAQALLGTGRFDLVVAAMRMPGLDGPGLWRWVQRLRPDLVPAMAFATDDAAPRTVAFLRECGRPAIEKPASYAGVRDMLAWMAREG